jgi:hypothetical protein
MTICPTCSHQNPQGALQCEACYASLEIGQSCPNCGANVQQIANFCGQCGFSLKEAIPQQVGIDPGTATQRQADWSTESGAGAAVVQEPPLDPSEADRVASPEENRLAPVSTAEPLETVKLLHLQTNVALALPDHLDTVYLGKPNERSSPDLDLAGLPDSDIVSRVHARILREGSPSDRFYYLEDLGSSNGTYLNNLPLKSGKRYRLQTGDRIALGKGDLVTFLFQS